MAKKYSEDPGSASKGGEYDGVVRGQMAPEFEKASFSLKPMAISDPVKTQYGYHIIQVLAHEDARLKPLAEVKDELAKQWKQARVADIMQRISDKVQAALQKDPDHPDQAIAGLKKGEISQPVSPAANKVAIAEVTGIVPAHPATFDEVKTRIHDTMVSAKLIRSVQDNAKALVDAAKANGGDLAKAAKAMGLETKTTELFKRQATVDGLGSASYVDDAFKSPVGTILPPVGMPEATVVVKVVQRGDADLSQLPEQRGQIVESIKEDKARERNTMFETGLVDALTKQGVVKMHPEVITRIISSFRTGS